jgi:hypothetical protein
MKTLSLTFALVATLFSTAVFAQETVALNNVSDKTIAADARIVPPAAYYTSFQAAVFPRKNGNIAVHVAKGIQEQVVVKVYDKTGKIISEEKLSKHGMVNSDYVTKGLAKGTYTFEVASQSKVYRKDIDVE